MLDDLTGRVALVTGATRGIGNAIAVAVGKAGADVAVNYRSRDKEAHQTCAEIEKLGRRTIAVKADVSLAADVGRLVAAVEAELGPVAILVNNAGITHPQSIAEITEEDWNEIVAVNLKSVFLVTQAVLPKMRADRWGRIIDLSSVAAQTGGGVGPHYAASKAGIVGLTHSYANLLARNGYITGQTINVNGGRYMS
jgi:3-oxoacyl-[acyl-carrier protein] reductase